MQQPDDVLTPNIKQAAKSVFQIDETIPPYIFWPLLAVSLLGWYEVVFNPAVFIPELARIMSSTLEHRWLTFSSLVMAAGLAIWQIYRHFPDSLFAGFNLLMMGLYAWLHGSLKPYSSKPGLLPFEYSLDVYLLILLLTAVMAFVSRKIKWYFYIIGGLGYKITLEYISYRLTGTM